MTVLSAAYGRAEVKGRRACSLSLAELRVYNERTDRHPHPQVMWLALMP